MNTQSPTTQFPATLSLTALADEKLAAATRPAAAVARTLSTAATSTRCGRPSSR